MTDDAPIDALKAMAHPVRFSILRSLANGEHNVGEIEEATGIGQPSLSQQLAVLRNADLVLTRKDAKLVFYRLDEQGIQGVSDAIAMLTGGRTMPARPQKDSVPGAANFARLS